MKRKSVYIAFTCVLLLLLSGCSGSSFVENVSGQSPEAGQAPGGQGEASYHNEITVGYVTCDASGSADGNVEISDCQSTFYRYDGRRWWRDLNSPAAEFTLNCGKYSPYSDSGQTPASEESQSAVYAMVESFNEGGWEYIGNIDLKSFYIDRNRDVMLCFIDDTDNYQGGAELPNGEKLFLAGILLPSVN